MTAKMVGLDLGLKSMLITSDGVSHGNRQFAASDEKKLDMFLSSSPLRSVNGPAPNVASITIETSTRQTTFLPPDWRSMPVERA
jgi:hypothetical protein